MPCARCPPDLPSRQKLERFLSDLACERNVAASTQNQALNAILFFYKEVLNQPVHGIDALRAKRLAPLRHAPTLAQTHALLRAVPDLGTPKAITAMAHKLARILWHLLKYQEPYDPAVWAKAEEKNRQKKIKHLEKNAASLGFQLVSNS